MLERFPFNIFYRTRETEIRHRGGGTSEAAAKQLVWSSDALMKTDPRGGRPHACCRKENG